VRDFTLSNISYFFLATVIIRNRLSAWSRCAVCSESITVVSNTDKNIEILIMQYSFSKSVMQYYFNTFGNTSLSAPPNKLQILPFCNFFSKFWAHCRPRGNVVNSKFEQVMLTCYFWCGLLHAIEQKNENILCIIKQRSHD